LDRRGFVLGHQRFGFPGPQFGARLPALWFLVTSVLQQVTSEAVCSSGASQLAASFWRKLAGANEVQAEHRANTSMSLGFDALCQ